MPTPSFAALSPILEKVQPLQGTAEFDGVYFVVSKWVLASTTTSQARSTCQRIATMCHSRAWRDRASSTVEIPSWADFLDELKALSLQTADRCEQLDAIQHDETHPEVHEIAPLCRFSVYSQLQVAAVQRLATELEYLLDAAIEDDVVDTRSFQRIYGLFWLWVLATYEVSRTMSEYRSCFSTELGERILAYKRHVAVLRIPFAKQQFAGRKEPIGAEASISAVDARTKDLAFSVEGRVFWVRELLSEFEELIQSIKPKDILRDLREAQS